MAVIYDDTIVVYDYGLITFDGDAGAGTMTGAVEETSAMTGAMSETSSMTGAMTETSTMTATITY